MNHNMSAVYCISRFFLDERLAVCNRNVVIHITWQTSKIHHITLIHIAIWQERICSQNKISLLKENIEKFLLISKL